MKFHCAAESIETFTRPQFIIFMLIRYSAIAIHRQDERKRNKKEMNM